ncbi:unnamed protein product [Amoebophrya sp. A120]|nr:unnamed protein product [Amoebophrya sp. A120]|eukprot:GSA120T00026153001.1
MQPIQYLDVQKITAGKIASGWLGKWTRTEVPPDHPFLVEEPLSPLAFVREHEGRVEKDEMVEEEWHDREAMLNVLFSQQESSPESEAAHHDEPPAPVMYGYPYPEGVR